MTISIYCDFNKVGIHEGDSKFYRISTLTVTTGTSTHSFFVTQYGAIPDKLRPTLVEWFSRPESDDFFNIFMGYGRVDYDAYSSVGETAPIRCRKQASEKFSEKVKRGYRFKNAGIKSWTIEDSQLRDFFSHGVDPLSLRKVKEYAEPHAMLHSAKTETLANEFRDVFMAMVTKTLETIPERSGEPKSLSELMKGTGSVAPSVVVDSASPAIHRSVLWGTW